MSRSADVPNLGEFVVEGFARRMANSKGMCAQSVPVIKVRRGRDTFTVMLQDATVATPKLDRLFKVGDRLEFRGLQLRDVILTSLNGITRRPPQLVGTHTTAEAALAFLYTKTA